MKCFLVSDLHGNTAKYGRLLQSVEGEKPDAVFIAGDILPNQIAGGGNAGDFLEEVLLSPIHSLKARGIETRFFVIMGNDDPRKFEDVLLEADEKGELDYVHNRKKMFCGYVVAGYAHVPPTPFLLKDWERYDVSRFVDVGAVSPEEGLRTVPVDARKVRFSTIAKDLEKLAEGMDMERSLFLFHSPPYNTALDRADLDGVSVDHAPVDVHIGSIAIQRFIEEKRPHLTMHGHVHESPRLTGCWMDNMEGTVMLSGAHDGSELALVRFDPEKPSEAERELLPVE